MFAMHNGVSLRIKFKSFYGNKKCLVNMENPEWLIKIIK